MERHSRERILCDQMWISSGRQHDVQHVRTQRKESQDDMPTTTNVAIESESCRWMESAQRVESFFERARFREETGSGGTATSSRSATVVTHAQTPKKKQMMKRLRRTLSKKRQTADTQAGGSSGWGSAAASPTPKKQRVVVPPEVPQDTRNSIEDMEISQLEVKREVSKVQGVSLDKNKRELQRLARNSVEYYFRDKQVEASDALIDKVGALLTESGVAQIIETFQPDRLAAKAGYLGLRPGFAIDVCENKPYGPHGGESLDLSKNSDLSSG